MTSFPLKGAIKNKKKSEERTSHSKYAFMSRSLNDQKKSDFWAPPNHPFKKIKYGYIL